MVETKTVADQNPKAQAVKFNEMTVLRVLQLIEAFDALDKGLDWQDVPSGTYRKIIGPRYEHGRMLEEVYKRWKSVRIYAEVLDLAANLPPSVLKRKEIKDGLRAVRAKLDS